MCTYLGREVYTNAMHYHGSLKDFGHNCLLHWRKISIKVLHFLEVSVTLLMCQAMCSLQSNFFKEMFHKRKMLNEEITFMAWQRSAIEKINDWSLCLSDNLLNKVLKGFIDETTSVYWWPIAAGWVPALFYVQGTQ